MLAILITMVLLTAVVFHTIPSLVRPTVFFAVTVPREFLRTGEARKILRFYRLIVWLNCPPAVALAWYGYTEQNPLFLIVGTTWQVTAGLFAFQLARKKAEPHRAQRIPQPSQTVPIPRRMPMPWLWIGPLLILGGSALYLNAHWDEIPQSFPTHWNISGEPDRWSERTPGTVYFPLTIGAAMLLMLWFVAHGIAKWSRTTAATPADAEATADQKNKTIMILLIVSYFTALLFAWLGMQRLNNTPVLSPLFIVMMVGVPIVGTIAILLVAYGVTHSPAGREAVGDGSDDRYWRGGVFYFNRNDPALFVPKRLGFGWTLNFGHPASWVILGLTMLLPILPILLR